MRTLSNFASPFLLSFFPQPKLQFINGVCSSCNQYSRLSSPSDLTLRHLRRKRHQLRSRSSPLYKPFNINLPSFRGNSFTYVTSARPIRENHQSNSSLRLKRASCNTGCVWSCGHPYFVPQEELFPGKVGDIWIVSRIGHTLASREDYCVEYLLYPISRRF